ncbi:hypothetical protein L1987_25799 [Smallanthus sonchifolius]|uniref:Uncharacterized protein n=1 Tax=Smallanthus sonchifolius TaxID=185202 RepID=A0ACB9I9A1_9ASTR|nr:hypothetical protein L1987_25799 [Smallanthus sonchifolius]
MDYIHLVTEESARESLIAISYGVTEEIAYLPVTEIASDAVTITRKKTIDELRSELISLASVEPLKIDKSTTVRV